MTHIEYLSDLENKKAKGKGEKRIFTDRELAKYENAGRRNILGITDN